MRTLVRLMRVLIGRRSSVSWPCLILPILRNFPSPSKSFRFGSVLFLGIELSGNRLPYSSIRNLSSLLEYDGNVGTYSYADADLPLDEGGQHGACNGANCQREYG